jgi:hypothetical protein
MRLTGVRQRITPTVDGKAVYISADRLVDKTTNALYSLVREQLSPKALQEAGDLRRQAGMPAEVFIQTAARNAPKYLIDPVLGFLQRSLREQ